MNDQQAAMALAEVVPGAQVSERFAGFTVTVPPEQWVAALAYSRDHIATPYFDFLTGVDEGDDGFGIVVHLYAPPSGPHLHVRTTCARDGASIPTATGVYAGAAWHERETHEMFGIDFPGHPHLITLLLPDGFEGHPLRKDFQLAARATKTWPGAKEPGDGGSPPPSQREGHGAPVPVEGRAKRTNVAMGTPSDPGKWPETVATETKHPEGRT